MPLSRPLFETTPVQIFALPGILPEHCQFVLDLSSRQIVVRGTQEEPVRRVGPLTFSATRILLALLSAYPRPCSYAELFLALAPTGEEEWVWDREVSMRSIRHAAQALTIVLRRVGLVATALRGYGYVLACARRGEERDPAGLRFQKGVLK
jgi:hypothetical protein